MTLAEKRQAQLQQLPGVDLLQLALSKSAKIETVPVSVVKSAARTVIEMLRHQILTGRLDDPGALELEKICLRAQRVIHQQMQLNLRQVINATGVIIHTNLGRSALSRQAVDHVAAIAGGYSNLEYDLSAGGRGSRTTIVEGLLGDISGAEAALAVNNNAGAVLLCLNAIAKDREVIVSRGELVEIGGSFRIPDVMTGSGCFLKEVGTTNRTHLSDYENAIGPKTALLLKVHKSNYDVVGFTAEVTLSELVRLGKGQNLPVMEDLGSGTFIDFSLYGLPREPTIQESVSTGVDLVTFSGDKLLGGPQAGIIIGRKKWLDRIRSNPVARALRLDKMSLAALEATLRLYRDPVSVVQQIPTLTMLTNTVAAIEATAQQLKTFLTDGNIPELRLEVVECQSRAGGGALPELKLPSHGVAVGVKHMTAAAIERYLRAFTPPVIGRIENDRFLLDVRTLEQADFTPIKSALEQMLQDKGDHGA